MKTLIFMCIGIAVGRWLAPQKLGKVNSKLQILITLCLICFMGISIGRNQELIQGFAKIGMESVLFCLIPSICSVFFVYVITRRGK